MGMLLWSYRNVSCLLLLAVLVPLICRDHGTVRILEYVIGTTA